jgi:hypothetical protein
MNVTPHWLRQVTRATAAKPPIGRDDDAAFAHGLGHTPHRTAAARQCVAFHTSFESRGIIGAPVNRDRAPAHNERDHQPMLVRFKRPGHGQAHCAVLGALRQGL